MHMYLSWYRPVNSQKKHVKQCTCIYQDIDLLIHQKNMLNNGNVSIIIETCQFTIQNCKTLQHVKQCICIVT